MSSPSFVENEKENGAHDGEVIRMPVPAVRLIVVDPGGRVLILRRANTQHSQGQWCLPGGKAEYGITLEDSARKELLEETSLRCKELRFLFHQDSLPESLGEMHCVNFYYACSFEGQVAINNESDDFAWITPRDLKAYTIVFRNEEGILRFWAK